jgi:hypothetical protein
VIARVREQDRCGGLERDLLHPHAVHRHICGQRAGRARTPSQAIGQSIRGDAAERLGMEHRRRDTYAVGHCGEVVGRGCFRCGHERLLRTFGNVFQT